MTFDEAEARFRDLQARVQRGEAISRAEYEDQVSQLAVQDDRGVLWEINPRTGKWMYFDGAEWVGGTPPGRDHSTVMPIPRAPSPPPPSVQPPISTVPLPGMRPQPPLVSRPQPRSIPASPSRPVAQPVSRPAATPRAYPSSAYPPGTYPPGSYPPGTYPPGAASPEPGPMAPSGLDHAAQGAVPLAPGAPPHAGMATPMPPRVLRQGPVGMPSREWVPLAIGAIVLFLCAIMLFFGGRFVLAALGPSTTPTRLSALTLATNTPLPTTVSLPTQVMATTTPQPVIAKIIEPRVNVRAGPSTKDKILSKLSKDNQIALTARNKASDWYQVNITGGSQPGWVFGETLEIVSGEPSSLPVAGPQ